MTPMRHATRTLIPRLVLAAAVTACAGKSADTPAGTSVNVPPTRSPSTGVASTNGGDADERESGEYTLTMDEVRKWAAITAKMNATDFSKSAPTNVTDMSDNPTIDQLEKYFDGSPQIRAMISDGGLDVRDFVVITNTMMQGGLAQYMLSEGTSPDSVAKATKLSVANQQFFKEHKAELAQLQAAAMKKKS